MRFSQIDHFPINDYIKMIVFHCREGVHKSLVKSLSVDARKILLPMICAIIFANSVKSPMSLYPNRFVLSHL